MKYGISLGNSKLGRLAIPEYVKAGKVTNDVGDAPISYISRRDLAEAGVHCLLDEGHDGKTYTLTGPEAVTQAQLAAWISEWTGKKIPAPAGSVEADGGPDHLDSTAFAR